MNENENPEKNPEKENPEKEIEKDESVEKDESPEEEEKTNSESENEANPKNEEETEVDIPAGESNDEIVQTVTIIDTPKGSISVVHDITLGDLIISTILMAFLIFYVINQFVRRF